MLDNEEVVVKASEMLKILQDAGWQLIDYIRQYDEKSCSIILSDMETSLSYMLNTARFLYENNSRIKLKDALACAIDSLKRIGEYMEADQLDTACNKLEFELIPILEVAYLQFEYWARAYPDADRIQSFRKQIVENMPMNRYIEKSEKEGKYKYDLSIYVVGYNKLEYTKDCIENILKNIPEGITYELILLNHGSTDGTKEYFESVNPNKQLDISVNGAVPFIPFRVHEGEYLLTVSNDVIMTENSIKNLLEIVKENKKIGWVVPATSNISNLQTLPVTYSSFEELQQFAKKNNVRDVNREEQRVRLCNPLTMMRSAPYNQLTRELFVELCCPENFHSFPDDKCCLWYRRNGYKLILAKDAYCHHAASQTLRDDTKKTDEQQFYLQGRKDFLNAFGVDPWGIGMCFSLPLLKLLSCTDTSRTKILGVNCGLGGNPLKIRETIKENTGNYDVEIHNYTAYPAYKEDLTGVSDKVTVEKDIWKSIRKIAGDFRYIIIEEGLPVNGNTVEYLYFLALKMAEGSHLCVRMDNAEVRKKLKKFKFTVKEADEWIVLEK